MTSAFGEQKVPMMTSANNVGSGWHPLIRALEEKLNTLDPNFELHQVKEKFGALRYYAQFSSAHEITDTGYAVFQGAIAHAEEASTHICEVCGRPGETRPGHFGWMKTLCAEHQAERQKADQEMVDELGD